jgi:hypothetical protein
MRDDDDFLDLGGGQVADLGSEGFWRSPERLKAAATALREKAQRVDHRFTVSEPETKPEPPSLAELIGHRRIDDPPFDEAAARFNQAKAQIMVALEREEQQAEQQQAQARERNRTAVANTGLGKLLRI